jgi:hypothetical protein
MSKLFSLFLFFNCLYFYSSTVSELQAKVKSLQNSSKELSDEVRKIIKTLVIFYVFLFGFK